MAVRYVQTLNLMYFKNLPLGTYVYNVPKIFFVYVQNVPNASVFSSDGTL